MTPDEILNLCNSKMKKNMWPLLASDSLHCGALRGFERRLAGIMAHVSSIRLRGAPFARRSGGNQFRSSMLHREAPFAKSRISAIFPSSPLQMEPILFLWEKCAEGSCRDIKRAESAESAESAGGTTRQAQRLGARVPRP